MLECCNSKHKITIKLPPIFQKKTTLIKQMFGIHEFKDLPIKKNKINHKLADLTSQSPVVD